MLINFNNNYQINPFFRIYREGTKVSHYIINLCEENSKKIYKIGDKTFSTMKDLLSFYKQRLLDTSPLVRIVCLSSKKYFILCIFTF